MTALVALAVSLCLAAEPATPGGSPRGEGVPAGGVDAPAPAPGRPTRPTASAASRAGSPAPAVTAGGGEPSRPRRRSARRRRADGATLALPMLFPVLLPFVALAPPERLEPRPSRRRVAAADAAPPRSDP